MYLRQCLYLNVFLYFWSQQLIMRHLNMATNCTLRRVPHTQTDQHSLIQLNNHFVMIGSPQKISESTFCYNLVLTIFLYALSNRNFHFFKLLNFYNIAGIRFQNIAANDAVITSKINTMITEGWELAFVTSAVESDSGKGDGTGIFITRYIFKRNK